MTLIPRIVPALLASFTLSQAVWGEQQPLWEFGLGAGAFSFPDYRGSDERSNYLLPVPYFIYRGDFLKVDRQSIRGELFHNRDVELSLSLNASVPVNSDHNRARSGMPDLDPTLEIGPSLHVTLARYAQDRVQLGLHLPLRAVIATDFSHASHEGWILQPKLNLDVAEPFGQPGWKLGLQAGPLFASAKYHDYFYGVDAAFATAARPAYAADGGYSGSQVLAAASKRFPHAWVGAFLRWDSLQGAVIDDSPLVRDRSNFSGGLVVTWIFAQSSRSVETSDPGD
jgi:outer membrane scaffolding protein for murein synthesis (MipA/OmpV family)